MDAIITIISWFLITVLFVSPFLIMLGLNKLNFNNRFVPYLILSLIVSSALILTLAWWTDQSDQFLLSHYGYDFDAMNEIETFENVLPENMARVKELEISMMGIGWPLKAILSYVFYVPYILIVYLSVYFYKKFERRIT